MTVTVRQTALANTEERLPLFLKTLSITFFLSCSTAPQYSLESFRGTSVFSMSSLERYLHYSFFFVFISKMIHTFTCAGIQTYVNVICSQHCKQSGASFRDYAVYYHKYICWEGKIQIISSRKYKWNTKILMYLDKDIHVGRICNFIIQHYK